MPAVYYDSKDINYKTPFGAVKAMETVTIRLCASDDSAGKVFLYIQSDDKDTADVYEMNLDVTARGGTSDRFYSCQLSLETGLYWYFFIYEANGESFSVRPARQGVERSYTAGGYSAKAGAAWQLSVYDTDYSTPDWLSGGVIYQIFPDRFRSSGYKKTAPRDRCIRSDWGAEPAWRQDDEAVSSGEYLGNDYFGGDLAGITQKLPYLQSLGVTCLYLNPIFEAHSNHRYNTADYFKIDPSLGTEEDFVNLCRIAKDMGIRVILDGVFSHTGDDSVYFNRYGRYSDVGAYQSTGSPYYSWFKFKQWPDSYDSWWGIATLPEVDELNTEFDAFITGEKGVLHYWMDKGASGWRLDVADELPDAFLDNIRASVKSCDQQGLVLGEVWEDASNKISYGSRRRFLQGRQLDSVMNYPFRDAIIKFATGGDGDDLLSVILTVLENYPKETIKNLMNHVGTHDTPRILTTLGGASATGHDRGWQSGRRMTNSQRETAIKRLKIAAALQYTLPGVPAVYYGDEAGMEGYGDPFNRACYPWGGVSNELIDYYKFLGKLRKNPAFDGGAFIPVDAKTGYIAFIRQRGNSRVFIGINRWCDPQPVSLPDHTWDSAAVLAGNAPINGVVNIPAEGMTILFNQLTP